MPTVTHEGVLELCRRRPTLAVELVRAAFHVHMPGCAHAQTADTNLSEVPPVERSADLVLVFYDSPDSPPRRAIIVEVQLTPDPEKRRAWWWYMVGAHTRHRCDVRLVVVAPTGSVARWAARPLRMGHPGVVLRPIVIGPAAVPVTRDETEAILAPELAVLSALVHARGPSAEDVERAALAAVSRLDADRAALYTDVMHASLHATARAILEGLMANGTYQHQSDFAERHVAEGRAEGKAQALLAFLDARGIQVSSALRARVLSCTDAERLDTWIARAATATTAADVIGE